jgi:hypothetical protein
MTSREFRLWNKMRWLVLNAKSRADHLDRIVPRLSDGDPLD